MALLLKALPSNNWRCCCCCWNVDIDDADGRTIQRMACEEPMWVSMMMVLNESSRRKTESEGSTAFGDA
jgi:hypothetical protein